MSVDEGVQSQEIYKISGHNNGMFLFDIDGVITNPLTGEVASEVVAAIAAMLERGEPVAFNTGRGIQLVMERVVAPLRQLLGDASALRHLCIAHEKGALCTTFDAHGNQQPAQLAPDIAIPSPALRADMLAALADAYHGTMFPGDEKVAIISPEMIVGVEFAAFQADQQRLAHFLQQLLQQHSCADVFRIDTTRIATDVEDRRLGKALGARRVLAWLSSRQVQSAFFVAIGDSPSDIEMAEEIHRQGWPVTMVYVGEAESLPTKSYPFPLFITQARCERGTVEYLRQHAALH